MPRRGIGGGRGKKRFLRGRKELGQDECLGPFADLLQVGTGGVKGDFCQRHSPFRRDQHRHHRSSHRAGIDSPSPFRRAMRIASLSAEAEAIGAQRDARSVWRRTGEESGVEACKAFFQRRVDTSSRGRESLLAPAPDRLGVQGSCYGEPPGERCFGLLEQEAKLPFPLGFRSSLAFSMGGESEGVEVGWGGGRGGERRGKPHFVKSGGLECLPGLFAVGPDSRGNTTENLDERLQNFQGLSGSFRFCLLLSLP